MGAEARRVECVHPGAADFAASAVASPPDFRQLLGEAAWMRLVPAVRARFAHVAGAAARADYAGRMERVERSFIGYLVAQACRLLGTPLAPWGGRDVDVDVRVFEDRRLNGVVWERIYHFAGRPPLAVRSTKVFTAAFGLLECVEGNLGMRLRVHEEEGALHFVSTSYFFRLGKRLVTLPLLITPGRAHVVHRDEGGGWFRFTLSIDHPLLGRTFFQDGLFRERESGTPGLSMPPSPQRRLPVPTP